MAAPDARLAEMRACQQALRAARAAHHDSRLAGVSWTPTGRPRGRPATAARAAGTAAASAASSRTPPAAERDLARPGTCTGKRLAAKPFYAFRE